MKSWSDEVFEHLVKIHNEWDTAIADLSTQFEAALSEAFSTFIDASELFWAELSDFSNSLSELDTGIHLESDDQQIPNDEPQEFMTGLAAFIDELTYPLFQPIDEFWVDDDQREISEIWMSYPTPISELPHLKACEGCSNYHGHAYGGNLLVCAIHPYGWQQSDRCPDWRGAGVQELD